MGSYGIGVTRLLGTIVEVLSDDKGIIWPKKLVHSVHLISLGENEKQTNFMKTYKKEGIEVLFDDREANAGEKFADSDLLGVPLRVVVSKRSLEEGGYEIKSIKEDKGKIVNSDELLKELKDYVFKTL
ncbi:MAG: His/Gly/Thr/Pro-type tRNA ligase C-terminal domain-containing protein [Candidatus Paceibacterota bacterium]